MAVALQSVPIQQPIASPAPITILGQNSTLTTNPRDRHKNTLSGLGITEVILGSLSFFLTVIALAISPMEIRNYITKHLDQTIYHNIPTHYYAVETGFTYSAQGIWCGVMIIITGILGIRVKSAPTRCMYIANMTMAILTATVAFLVVILSGIAAGVSFYSSGLIALHSIVTLLSFVAFVIVIIHSACCCSGVCYTDSPATTQRVVTMPQHNVIQPQTQIIHGTNTQLMMIPSQPILQAGVQPTSMTSYPLQLPTAPQQPQVAPQYENIAGIISNNIATPSVMAQPPQYTK